KCRRENLEFMRTMDGAGLGKQTAVDYVLEFVRESPVGHAQIVVGTLDRIAVHVGKIDHRPVGAPGLPKIGGARESPARHVLAELQHDESGKLIGGIFLASEDRHLKNIEHG